MAKFIILPIINSPGTRFETLVIEAIRKSIIQTIQPPNEYMKYPAIYLNQGNYRYVNMDFESLVNKLNGA